MYVVDLVLESTCKYEVQMLNLLLFPAYVKTQFGSELPTMNVHVLTSF